MSKNVYNIPIINGLRGLASLSVVLFHFVNTTWGYVTNETVKDVFWFGCKGINLFFIISGIVIPLSMIKSKYKVAGFGRFILKRFIRIEPPYLVAVAIVVSYLYARNYVPSSLKIDLTPSFRDIILHLGYLIPFVEGAEWVSKVFWTLAVEFQYYLFLALLFPLALSNKQVYSWLFNFIIIGLPFIYPERPFFFFWGPYFALGVFYALFLTKKYSLRKYFISSALACIVSFYFHGILDLSIGVGAIIVIHFFANYHNKIGDFFGKISYSLYLVHGALGGSFISFMSHRFNEPIGKFLVIISGVLIAIASAYVFWRFVERPSHIAAKKIKS